MQQEADDQVLDTVLSARETTWLHHLKAAADSGTVSGNSFLTAVRRRMESIVLALPSGSNAQRIQVGCSPAEDPRVTSMSAKTLGGGGGCPAGSSTPELACCASLDFGRQSNKMPGSSSEVLRLQAEYLKEVEGRAETLFKELNC